MAGLTAWALSGVIAAFALTSRVHARTDEPIPDASPRFEALRLTASDGLRFGAWLAERDGDPVAVVLAHGHGASRSALVDEARALRRAGASVMPISLRAHGDSEGERDDLGWSARHDVVAAVRELRRRRPSRPVVVLGYSAGAAAAMYSAETLRDEVAGWVLVAPYADLALATRHRTERYLPPGLELVAYGALRVGALAALPELDRMRPIACARALAAPSVFVAGELDDRAPPDEVLGMATRAPSAEMLVAHGIGHDELGRVVSSEVWPRIEAFVLDRAPSRPAIETP